MYELISQWLAYSPLAVTIIVAVGLVIGSAIMFALAGRQRQQLQQLQTELALQQQQLAQKTQQLEQATATVTELGTRTAVLQERDNTAQRLNQHLEQQLNGLQQQKAQLQARLASEQQARELQQQHAEEKLALLQQNKQQLLQEFEQLSQKIFEHKQQQFSQQSQQGLNSLLTPFREQLDGLRKKVEDVHLSDAKDRASLKAQMIELHKLNQQMTSEAHALTTALRGEHKTQGNWGEMVLETVLESSGLRKGIEYVREQSHSDENGQRYRPDVIINLPEGKHIVVDSKVSLTAYTDYVNADTDMAQAAALKRHLDSVRAHIRGLSDKAYQNLQGLKSPDFVFLFMPIEPAFMLAFQHDETLFNSAFEQKIVVVTPTTLLATLRTVSSLWAIERRNQSTEQLADQAGRLYDKLAVVVERFDKLGAQLQTVQKTYDEAWGSMKTGQGNLLSQADKFRKLGVRVKKEISGSLIEEAKAEDELYESIQQAEQDAVRSNSANRSQ